LGVSGGLWKRYGNFGPAPCGRAPVGDVRFRRASWSVSPPPSRPQGAIPLGRAADRPAARGLDTARNCRSLRSIAPRRPRRASVGAPRDPASLDARRWRWPAPSFAVGSSVCTSSSPWCWPASTASEASRAQPAAAEGRLECVEKVDASALGAIASCVRCAIEHGSTIRCFGAKKQVRQMLEVTRLASFLKFYDSEREAVASVNACAA